MVIASAHTCNRYSWKRLRPPECEPPLSPGNHHWQEPAISSPIKWRKSSVLEEPPNTHCRSRSLAGSHRGYVGFLLAADKGANLLDALGVAGGQHLRHLDDPVALQLGKHLVIIQLFRSSENHSSCIARKRKKVDFPAPWPPTRQSSSSYLEPGWKTRRIAPSRKCLSISST